MATTVAEIKHQRIRALAAKLDWLQGIAEKNHDGHGYIWVDEIKETRALLDQFLLTCNCNTDKEAHDA